jgi:hypothetical protein
MVLGGSLRWRKQEMPVSTVPLPTVTPAQLHPIGGDPRTWTPRGSGFKRSKANKALKDFGFIQ